MNSKVNIASQNACRNQLGFTLVELLITMAISAIVLTGIYTVLEDLRKSSIQQVELSTLQQNQRGALAIMERELRLIGMDMQQSNQFNPQFHVTDVRKFQITAPDTDANLDVTPTGSPILRMSLDLNDNQTLDGNETITYSLYDRDGDGQAPYELSRSTDNTAGPDVISGPERELVAEGIDAIGFAYAFDADDDGEIDRKVLVPGEPPAIIWAVDTDNDGRLDSDLGNNLLPAPVRPEAIRAVQFWILGRVQRPDPSYVDKKSYSVGAGLPKGPYNDHFRRWLLSEIVHCRNL